LKNKITADLIVSMQNTTINYIKGVGQIVLYQNSIPLSDEKWNPLISSERVLFYYKHIYPYFVKRYINSQTIFIAPTNWVREKLILKFRIPAENVVTIYSEIHYSDIQSVVPQNFDRSYYHFFYPSNNSKHKNHSILLSALKMMRDDLNIDISKVKLHFTLNPDRDNYLIKIIKQYKLAYNIVFEGILSKQNMDSYYKASDAMLFPSLIESFGLPLVEAAQFGIPILSADLPYAREVICKYSGAVFLPPKNPSDWARNMAKCISEHPVYDPCRIKFNSGLDDFIRIIHKTF
jgi:glycosyltransferase involved in cell wall biosynthesis